MYLILVFFFFQAEDGIRDLVRSRGLGDVYKRQHPGFAVRRSGPARLCSADPPRRDAELPDTLGCPFVRPCSCLLYTSDAADERSSVDLGGRRIIKKKKTHTTSSSGDHQKTYTLS